MTYKTRGIILKRSNFGEADRMLSIFTEKYGKIRVLAKGVRKPLSKLAGNTELFCLTDFVIAEGRNIDIVTGAEINKCYFTMRNGYDKTSKVFYLAELIEKLLPDNEPHPKIFDNFEKILEKLNGKGSQLLIEYFEINLLADLGYLPELFKCVACDKNLTPTKNYFSFENGGLVCESCRTIERSISDEAIKILRLFLKQPIEIAAKIKVNDKIIKEIGAITSQHLQHIHQKEFNAERFVKR